MSRGKSAAERTAEREIEYRARRAEQLAKVTIAGARVGGAMYIAHQGYLSVVALAGKVTFADLSLVVQGLASEKAAIGLPWVLSLLCLLLVKRERKLRKDQIELSDERIRSLEKALDARRSSSRLTKRGETNPEDRT